jgi:hypothetical protein
MFRFCPFDRKDEVINKLPDDIIWKNFTPFQQALWIMDETEARWHQMIKKHRSLNYVEILWGESWPGSFDLALNTIASLLKIDLKTKQEIDFIPSSHVSNDTKWSIRNSLDHANQDRSYKRLMQYKFISA